MSRIAKRAPKAVRRCSIFMDAPPRNGRKGAQKGDLTDLPQLKCQFSWMIYLIWPFCLSSAFAPAALSPCSLIAARGGAPALRAGNGESEARPETRRAGRNRSAADRRRLPRCRRSGRTDRRHRLGLERPQEVHPRDHGNRRRPVRLRQRRPPGHLHPECDNPGCTDARRYTRQPRPISPRDISIAISAG